MRSYSYSVKQQVLANIEYKLAGNWGFGSDESALDVVSYIHEYEGLYETFCAYGLTQADVEAFLAAKERLTRRELCEAGNLTMQRHMAEEQMELAGAVR